MEAWNIEDISWRILEQICTYRLQSDLRWYPLSFEKPSTSEIVPKRIEKLNFFRIFAKKKRKSDQKEQKREEDGMRITI